MLAMIRLSCSELNKSLQPEGCSDALTVVSVFFQLDKNVTPAVGPVYAANIRELDGCSTQTEAPSCMTRGYKSRTL